MEHQFCNSLQWPIYVINSVDKTKLPCCTLPLTQHHSFFRNLPPSPHFPIGWETSLRWGTSRLTIPPSPPSPPTQHYHQRVPFPQQKETLTRLNFLAFKQAWITISPARHAFLWLQKCLRQVRERFAEGLALLVLELSLAHPQGEMLIMLKGS